MFLNLYILWFKSKAIVVAGFIGEDQEEICYVDE